MRLYRIGKRQDEVVWVTVTRLADSAAAIDLRIDA